MAKFNHNGRWSVVFTGVVCLCATLSLAQPSLLPTGPPLTPSGRFGPRTEIGTLPYFIFAPGSYYLSNTLIQTVPGPGITIGVSDVTIDLNGHSLIGGGFAGSTAISVTPAPLQNITIFNGSVAFWSGAGINLVGAPGPSQMVRLEDLTVYGNGGTGISVPPVSIVRNVIVDFNAGWGLEASNYTKITNVVAVDNDFDGILAGFGCHVSDCVSTFNGMDGFALGPSTVTIGSTAVSNDVNGFELAFNNRVTDCTASNNGFGVGGGGDGFFAIGEGCILGGCSAFNNFDSGFASFIGGPYGGGNSVHDCIATFNGFASGVGDGFTAFRNVVNCTANSNFDNGIETLWGGNIHHNTCGGNFANGIAAFSDGNAIEENHVVGNTLAGITTLFNPGPLGNLAARNRAHANGGAAFAFTPFDTTGVVMFGPVILGAVAAHMANVAY